MLRTLWLVLIAAGCNGDEPVETDPETDPIFDCDADEDGFEALGCGGSDCDDEDAEVFPGAAERLGDELDQDCNGKPNLGFVVRVPIDGEPYGQWSFSDDGGRFGGLVQATVDRVDSVVVPVQPDAVADIVNYGPVSAGFTADPVRLWVGDAPVDAVAWRARGTDTVLGKLSAAGLTPLASAEGEPATWVSGAVVDDTFEVVGCGGGLVQWGSDASDAASMEDPSDRCAILGTGDSHAVLTGTVEPGPLNRWKLVEGGFADRVTLITNKSLAQIATTARRGQSIYTFTDAERIYVFDAQGRGAILDGGGKIGSIAVSGDGADSYALAWVTTAGQLKIAWGTIDEDPTIINTLVPDAETTVAVSLTGNALAVAWQEDGGWLVERALR